MDNSQLDKYFSVSSDSAEQLSAYDDLRVAGRVLAETINKLVPESASKQDLHHRLLRVIVDSELAIRLDGVATTTPMILTKH